MDQEGWAAIRVVCDLPRLRELHTTMGDIRIIANSQGESQTQI